MYQETSSAIKVLKAIRHSVAVRLVFAPLQAGRSLDYFCSGDALRLGSKGRYGSCMGGR